MKYGAKEISDMTNDELWNASLGFQKMIDNNSKVRESPRFKKRFAEQTIPSLNASFLELKEAIESELENRNK